MVLYFTFYREDNMIEQINLDEYLCYDGPLPIDPEVKAMSKEEIEQEFIKFFGAYLEKTSK